MRRTSLGLVLSAAVHVVGAAVVALSWSSSDGVAAAELRAAPSPPRPREPEPPALAPFEDDDVLQLVIVELPPDLGILPEVVVPPPEPAARLPGSRAAPATPAISTTASAVAAVAEPTPSLPEPSRSALSMRNALPTRLVVPDLRKIAERGPAVALASPVRGSEELQPAGRGTYRAESSGFTAAIGRDGTVKISDKPNFNVNLALPSPKAVGRGLADWYKDPYAQTRDREREAEQGRVPSGAVDDEEEQRKRPKTVPLVSGSFDVTDWLMRLSGRDPYFSAKLSMLNRTREARAQLATEYRAELLGKVVPMVREQAALVWKDVSQPAAARRRALFELWDDCAEKGEAEVIRAGKRARVALYGFIRAHASADGPDGYSAAELEALNRGRTSTQRFAPYPVSDAAEAPDVAPDAAPEDASGGRPAEDP